MRENVKFNVTGTVTDLIYKNRVLVGKRVGHNTITESLLHLILETFTDSAFSNVGSNPIGWYFVVGSGQATWGNTPPAVSKTSKYLENPIGAVEVTPFIMNRDTGNDYLRFVANFSETQCQGTWREFGVCRSVKYDNMIPFVGKPLSNYYLIDQYRHKPIVKGNDTRIQRTLDLKIGIT